jgi:tRNA modification GTPase
MLHRTETTNFYTHEEQAIVALCTPRGSGALALIRISGANALTVADHCARISGKQLLSTVPTHTIHHGHVIDPHNNNEIIDDVLFLVMHGPKTFTGQHTVEITCHNNPFIIDHIISSVISCSARHAQAGEFSRRAFLNGKIDLVQAEAINDLIHAQTEVALRRSMTTLKGSLSNFLSSIEEHIVHLLGYVEASFEFLDEEQRDFDFDASIKERTQHIIDQIKHIKADFPHQKQIREGIRIAIIGNVNAGKSTLFNALVKQERAIVADIAGTTRDSIETNVYRNGTFWLIVDTAGIRQTEDFLEQKSIDRSLQEAAMADIILLVIDATHPLTGQHTEQYTHLIDAYKEKIIVVVNKIDCANYNHSKPLHSEMPQTHINVSAKDQIGIPNLERAIEEKIQELFAQLNSPYLLNERQFKLLTEIETSLEFIANSYSDGVHYEMIAYQLKDLLEKITELTGRNVTENVLNTIFDEFCVGK